MPEVTFVLLAWALMPSAFIQVADPEARPLDRPVLAAGTVDYWGSKKEAPKVKKGGSPSAVSVWAEPIRMPDGRFSVYLPAPQVLRFLDDPTPETAKGYLEWQKERVTKLRRAMEVLEATRSVEEGKDPVAPPDAGKGPAENTVPAKSSSPDLKLKAPQTDLIYFRRDGCAYCDRQEPILETIRSRRPDVAQRRVSSEDSPDLWSKYSVTVTPTVVVETAGKRPIVLRGLASMETILKTLPERGADAER